MKSFMFVVLALVVCAFGPQTKASAGETISGSIYDDTHEAAWADHVAIVKFTYTNTSGSVVQLEHLVGTDSSGDYATVFLVDDIDTTKTAFSSVSPYDTGWIGSETKTLSPPVPSSVTMATLHVREF